MNLRKPLLATLLLVSPTLALAHPGHDHAGVLSGIAHPVFGLDHLLAMVAVGLWAAQQTGKARWALPLIFVATMLLGVAGLSRTENGTHNANRSTSLMALRVGLCIALLVEILIYIAYIK